MQPPIKNLRPDSFYIDARDESAIIHLLKYYSQDELLSQPLKESVENDIVLAIEIADKSVNSLKKEAMERDEFIENAVPQSIPTCEKCGKQMVLDDKILLTFLPPHCVSFCFSCEECGTSDSSYSGDCDRFSSDIHCEHCNNVIEYESVTIDGKPGRASKCAECGNVSELKDMSDEIEASRKEQQELLSKFRHILYTDTVKAKLANNITSTGPRLKL